MTIGMQRPRPRNALAAVMGWASAALFASTSTAALAQTASATDQGTVLPELVVTAQKRTEKLREVPISISVLTGDHLDQSSAPGVADELSLVPGVAITPVGTGAGAGNPQISIRGVAAAGGVFVGANPIGYYLDSVPFGFVKSALTPDASAYDLERVEVLRGPQGTLYGVSAQNGVVRILTKDADLSAFELKARASASQTKYGGGNYRGDAAVNIPIIDGKLAARAVIGYQEWSGWIDRPNEKDANSSQILNLRLKVNAQPIEKLSVGLSAWISRSDFDAPPTGDVNRRSRVLTREPIEADYDAYGLKLGYEFNGFTATSATSYLDYQSDNVSEQGALNGSNILTTKLDAEVFAQEINLTSTDQGPWRWSLGGIYRDANDTDFQTRNTSAGPLCCGYLAPTDLTFFSKSYAAFGELTHLFAGGKFGLTGGLRYFKDDTSIDERSRNNIVGGIPSAGLLHTSRSFEKVSPRVVLTWHPNHEFTAYTSYSEGFRSGSDQFPAAVAAAQGVGFNLPPTDSDNLKNYEVGAKGTLLGGHLLFDAALYYMDWQRVQTPLLIPAPGGLNLVGTINSVSASGAGFDLGVSARPLAGLTLTGNFSVNDLTQDADVRTSTTLVFRKGERLNLSPKYTAAASIDYTVPLGGSGLTARASLSETYISERSQRLFAIASATVNDKPLTLLAARLSLEAPRGWMATLFVDNLTNEQNAVLSNTPAQLPDLATRMRPRTFGLQFDYRY